MPFVDSEPHSFINGKWKKKSLNWAIHVIHECSNNLFLEWQLQKDSNFPNKSIEILTIPLIPTIAYKLDIKIVW